MSGATISRHPAPRQGHGYELRIGVARVVTVRPSLEGWQVNNIGAGCTAKWPFRHQADAQAERIARLLAAT